MAYYLTGDLDKALDAYRQCLNVSNNPDMLVATAYWLHMTLRRLGREDEATAVLDMIDPEMDIIENHSYHQLLRLNKEQMDVAQIVDTSGEADAALANATVGYGIGDWHAANGRTELARETWQGVVSGSQWAAFGYIAAEADLVAGR